MKKAQARTLLRILLREQGDAVTALVDRRDEPVSREEQTMPVIIISSDSYEKGRQIAEETAKAAGYELIDLEILGPVAARYGVPEAFLRKALDESPSLLGISAKSQSLYLAYIEEATLSRLSGDNVVCHGLGAHRPWQIGRAHV